MKDKSTVEQQENTREAFTRVLLDLVHVNYKILEIIDERLTGLEDQVELLKNKKKKGN